MIKYSSVFDFFYFKKSSGRSTIKISSIPTKVLTQQDMKITSPVFENNKPIPSQYTCDGENVNPPLQFSGVPDNAKSLVLIVDDPDAPMGTWVHWVIFNIPPTVSEIKENSTPGGIEGVSSFGKQGYGAPCPPSGTHRYFFKLYALDTLLSLSNLADKKTVEDAMENHILSQAEFIVLYSNK